MPNVLIVEDDPSVARLLELTLGVEGMDTEVVAEGAAARARLAGPATDLVVLDVMLPGVDGLTLLRELRERRAWSSSRVIVLTALDRDEQVWAGWAAGADYYLTKPFDVTLLCDVAQRLLAGEDRSAAAPA